MTDIGQSACPARGPPCLALVWGAKGRILMGAASVPSWTEGPRGQQGQETLEAPTRGHMEEEDLCSPRESRSAQP